MEETNKTKEGTPLFIFEAVNKFKSSGRAFRRGLATSYGKVYPNRPFNNRANTCKRKNKHSRIINETKKYYYEQLKARSEPIQ